MSINLVPQSCAITMVAGDDKSFRVNLSDGTDPLDITGAVLQMTIQIPEEPDITPTIAVTDGVNGEFEVTLAAADTAGLSGSFPYFITMTRGGLRETVLRGTFAASQN